MEDIRIKSMEKGSGAFSCGKKRGERLTIINFQRR